MEFKTTIAAVLMLTLSISAATAQEQAQKKPCITSDEVTRTEKKNSDFINNNMSNLRQADREKIAAMLDKAVTTPLRQGASDCSSTGREGVKEDVRSSFNSFYYQIGPGGRQLFDNYEIPMHKGQWLGGSGIQ